MDPNKRVVCDEYYKANMLTIMRIAPLPNISPQDYIDVLAPLYQDTKPFIDLLGSFEI